MRIEIAEKSHETRRDCWGGHVNHKSLFWLYNHWANEVYEAEILGHKRQSQNRDLWFTWPPQRSLVSWLFFSDPYSHFEIVILKYIQLILHMLNEIGKYSRILIIQMSIIRTAYLLYFVTSVCFARAFEWSFVQCKCIDV